MAGIVTGDQVTLQSSQCSAHLIPRNVVVVGETGAGKSSFINLVTGEETARVGNDARGVTLDTIRYPWQSDDQSYPFHLWDTPGLNEGSRGSVSHKAAQRALRALLKKLNKEGGVHLLVVCMRGIARVTKGTKWIYDTILSIRNQVSPQIPVVAVITDLEKRCNEANIQSSMEEWWTDNKRHLTSFGMAFSGHACLTTVSDKNHPDMLGRRAVCQQLARNLLINHSLLLKPTHNIVIVGESGVWNSSIINLVTGTDSAVTIRDVRATRYHDWNLSQTRKFRLWDTPGLSEGPGSISPGGAHEALRSLLTELGQGAGVHLFVICFPGGRRVIESMKQTYDAVLALRNRICPDIPIVAVTTKPESKCQDIDNIPTVDKRRDPNTGVLSDFYKAFAAHAYITTLSDGAHPPVPGRRNRSRGLIRDLIVNNAAPSRRPPTQDLHVVLFGETGVGKSSLVNLLAGWQVAEVSPDSVACTLESTEYQFQLGMITMRLWDTVGLEVPEKGILGYTDAIEKAADLIRELNSSGGINLLLFCIRGSRVTQTMQSNYRLFHEVLCKRQVPIALAVTHLEPEEDMENWWKCNSKTLEYKGIHVSGHACTTTLGGHPRCAESRSVVRDMLSQYAGQAKFSMPSETWLSRFLSGLSQGLSLLFNVTLPGRKELTQILMERCHLEPHVAERVAKRIGKGT